MPDIVKKPLTVVLVAVLLFSVCFPVPVGMRALDDVRIKQAQANPAAAAVPVIVFGTALAAYGVYVSASTQEDYTASLGQLYTSYQNYMVDLGQTAEETDAFISAAYNSAGNVDLSVLTTSAFPTIAQWARGLLQSGEAIQGSSSTAAMTGAIYFGNVPFAATSVSGWPYVDRAIDYAANGGGVSYAWETVPLACKQSVAGDGVSVSYHYFFYRSRNGNPGLYSSNGNYYLSISYLADYNVVVKPDGTINDYKSQNLNNKIFQSECVLNSDYPWTASNVSVSNGVMNQATAVISDAIANGTAVAPSAVVQPFEPTAEMLEEGYTTADVVEAINGATGELSGIAEQIGVMVGLLAPLSGLAQNVQSIKDAWAGAQASPFSWLTSWWDTLTGWWNSLLSWLGSTPIGQLLQPLVSGVNAVVGWIGSTPFGTVMQTVIDGVQAIPGAVAGAADVVVGGLEGVLEGVLDGVLSIPDALAGVLEGVLSIPDSIAAVLDGLFAAEADMQYEPVSDGLQMRDDLKMQLDAMLDMKAPFCYMRRMQALASNVAGNFGGDASFYFDIDIPFAGSQRFDAGEILNSYWGSMTVAQYIRVMLTATMCAGLLAVSLKIAIGRIGKKE